MKKLLATLCLFTVAGVCALSGATSRTVVRFHTTLGDIDVELYPDTAPKTVANFLGYVDRGDYSGSFIHRSVPGFIIQGGGYKFVNNQTVTIPTQPAVVNEFNRSNLRGTIAMAKLGSSPDSATDQWFFNLSDGNASNLDNQNGGFTVFGKITSDQGLAVVDAIAALKIFNFGSPFDALPTINYTNGATITSDNLMNVSSIMRLPAPDFFAGEVSLGDDNYFLKFPGNNNVFGYYKYLSTVNFVYHYDLGFEYVFDAADGNGGVYLYDFTSNDFFYTSPTFAFPYLYDFGLQAFLYYYPDPGDSNHYNTSGVRYFFNFSTGQVIKKKPSVCPDPMRGIGHRPAWSEISIALAVGRRIISAFR